LMPHTYSTMLQLPLHLVAIFANQPNPKKNPVKWPWQSPPNSQIGRERLPRPVKFWRNAWSAW
jgi:hypothetical protein